LVGKSVAFKSFWSIATQIGVLFGGAVSSVILNRSLKPEGRGEVALVTFWPTIVGAVLVAGWIPAIVAHVSRKPEDSRTVWSAWVLVGLALAMPLMAAGWFLVPAYIPNYPELWSPSRLYLLAILFGVLGTSAQAVLEANGHFELAAFARLSQVVVLLPILLVLTLCGALVTNTYLLLLLGLTGLMNFCAIWLMVRATHGDWKPAFFDTPHYFLRAAPFDCLVVFQQRADQTLILTLMAPDREAFGIYVAGSVLGGMLAPIATGLAPVLFTHGARQTESEAVQLVQQVGRAFVLVGFLIGIPAALLAEPILRWAYGEAFQSAAPVMRVSLLNAVLGGLFLMLINTLRGMNRPGTATLIGIASCLVSTAGAAFLLPQLGYIGSACGQTLGYSVGLGLMWLLLRAQGLSLLGLVPTRADLSKGLSLVKRGLAYRPRAQAGETK
jgi:O-antigen/teichoic acid export membrane protein